MLNISIDPRADKNHVFMSMQSVYCHILLYMSDFSALSRILINIKSFSDNIIKNDVSCSFYNTSSNLIRCISLLSARHIAKSRDGHADQCIRLAIKLLRIGMSSSDGNTNFVHFEEYSHSTNIISMLIQMRRENKNDSNGIRHLKIAETLAPLAIRVHFPDKKMEARLAEYFRS